MHGVGTAISFAVIQMVTLFLAARADSVLWLPDDSTGLLEHPGMISIVIGNAILPIISTHAKLMTCKIGRKLPSKKPPLIRRYYQSRVLQHAFGIRVFKLAFTFFVVIGVICLIAQTVRLYSPSPYGHDTFDSYAHPWSFWVSRPILLLSWALIIPWFGATLLAHLVALSTLLAKVRKRSLTSFYLSHPDRCGGYSFFGWTDVWYAFGIVVVLTETVLLILTHNRLAVGNIIAAGMVIFSALLISFFSVIPVLKILAEQKSHIKASAFHRLRRGARLSLEHSAILFDLRFTPYTVTAANLAVVARLLIAINTAFPAGRFATLGM